MECGLGDMAAARAVVAGKTEAFTPGAITVDLAGTSAAGSAGGIPICFETAVTKDNPVVADIAVVADAVDMASSSRP